MNDYKKDFEKSIDFIEWQNDMLKKQADRIAELEKESANLEQSLKNALIFIDNHKQTKPLSDEEIDKILESLDVYIDTHAGVKLFARAIEERHGIK